MKRLVSGLVLASTACWAPAQVRVDVSGFGDDFRLALDATPGFGSSAAVTPEGRVFLAFQADVLISVADGRVGRVREYRDYAWREVEGTRHTLDSGVLTLDGADRLRAFRRIDPNDAGYLPDYQTPGPDGFETRGRYGAAAEKPKVYQLMLRLFGNENETRKRNGTLAENGTGKFSDLSPDVLARLRETGYTHLWITGVLQQATSTDYAEIGQPADDPDLLKGIAGSPYAIKDYFDVCPDYADDPRTGSRSSAL